MAAEESERSGGSRARLGLAWAWLALLAGAVVLGELTEIGPLVWAETWWAVNTGSLLGAGLLLALLILGWPALSVLFGAADRAGETATGQAGLRRHTSSSALFLLGAAGIGLATAAIAWLQLSRLPDGREPPLWLTAEALAQGVAHGRRVIVAGAPVEQARAAFMAIGRGTGSRWAYTGFRPGATRAQTAAEPDARPIALFLERRELTAVPPMIRERLPQQETVEGQLVENGLPEHARVMLERAGVRIADPHYLLRDNVARGGHYRTLILLGLVIAALMAAVAGLVWLIGAVPIRSRR